MFIKNSNVIKCRETKWQFLSKNIENRLCTQAMLKTENFFQLTVPVKKNHSSFISEQNAAMLSLEILVYCFNPLSFSDFKFSAWNFITF